MQENADETLAKNEHMNTLSEDVSASSPADMMCMVEKHAYTNESIWQPGRLKFGIFFSPNARVKIPDCATADFLTIPRVPTLAIDIN